MTSYQRQFHPLERGTRQIRILLVRPGKEDQRIVCEHEIVSLEKPGEFEAVSYCWGQRDNSREITLNGTPFRISSSLESTLRYLRQAIDSRRLWIDAISIDQKQNEEKLHQVAQMRSIYESASQVLVWLGPPSDNSDAGFDLMEKIATRPSHVEKSGKIVSQPIELPLGPLAGLLELLLRPYWRRMWIIQEISVASKDPIVGCGTKWLPWGMLSNALREVYVRLSNAEAKKKRGEHDQLQVFSEARYLTDVYTDLFKMRLQIQGEVTGVPRSLPDLFSNNPWTNLLELFAESRSRFSTDPRDRIFALLGLLRSKAKEDSKLDHCLTPDYTKTHWRVYREATKLAMETEETLEVLQYKNHLNCSELPSWVPDFSKHWSHLFPTLGPDHWHDWSASGNLRTPLEVRFRVSLDLETLYANGAFVDSIERVVNLQRVDTTIRDVIHEVHSAVFDSVGNNSDPTLSGSRYLIDAIWRSLIGNRSAENALPANSDFRDLYLALVEHSTQSVIERSDSEVDFRPFTDSVLQAVRISAGSPYRRFIISKKGLLGLGTPDCQHGDSICILSGYKMPVILRPLRKYHRLLGSAYVHGIMHGEGIPCFELSEKLFETFVVQ